METCNNTTTTPRLPGLFNIPCDKQAADGKKCEAGKPFLTTVSSYSTAEIPGMIRASQSLLSNASKGLTIPSGPMEATAL